jgi:List-Bact-rpt repeat protein
MNAAKNVSAAFSGTTPPTGNTATLTLIVRGRGTVSASGGACASSGPARTCKQSYDAESSIELTAAPATGAKFLGWSGSCGGSTTTCRVELSASATVEATFSAATAGTPLATRGRPVVKRGKTGFAVTLRFRAGQSGIARVRAIRAGRIETALAFSVGPGPGSVGPLLVQKPGYYRFELRLGARAIEWQACLGRCGETAPGGPFRVVREQSAVVRAGEAWSVTVRFHTNRLSGAELRISRGKRLVTDVRFAPLAGQAHAGPFVLTPGVYTLRLTMTDAYGRTRRLSWFAYLRE